VIGYVANRPAGGILRHPETTESPLHDDFFFERDAEHGFSAFADDGELEKAAGAENGHKGEGLFRMIGGEDADGFVLVAADGGTGGGRCVDQTVIGNVGNQVARGAIGDDGPFDLAGHAGNSVPERGLPNPVAL